MLFSALRCLLIELNEGMYSSSSNNEALKKLAKCINEVVFISEQYPATPENLKKKLVLLYEVRNEIVHPAHAPSEEKNNTPAYLSSLREEGLLQSAGTGADYIWVDQLQSHRLFVWAFDIVRETVDVLLDAHGVPDYSADGLRQSYARYQLAK